VTPTDGEEDRAMAERRRGVRRETSRALSPSQAEGVRNAHAWFEVNSGWAPPTDDTLAEWLADGVCRCPDECLVSPDGRCDHGLASWWLILEALKTAAGSATLPP
jgi:hypothetical protein